VWAFPEIAMSHVTAQAPPRTPAEVYDAAFVPALFSQWGPVVAEAAGVDAGDRVLDIACGTGVLALAAAERAGPKGVVVGLDANEQMLDIARRKHAGVEWRLGRAESLPFDDCSFDAAVSQFGLMFFDDRVAALREAMRVLRPGGRLAIAVWDDVERSPGYAALAALLQRLFGDPVAQSFRAPFVLGDRDRLLALAAQAGIAGGSVRQVARPVRFASIRDLVATERACVWTLGGLLDERQFERLLVEAQAALRPFVDADGGVAFDVPALILVASKA
jgi:SAM-dependent methyltransferase